VTETPAAEQRVSAVEAWPWLSTAKTLARRFREDRLALIAGGLTFTTVISLVPLLTVMLALFSAFPVFAKVQASLQDYFLQALVPDVIASRSSERSTSSRRAPAGSARSAWSRSSLARWR
jgi:membrane protein